MVHWPNALPSFPPTAKPVETRVGFHRITWLVVLVLLLWVPLHGHAHIFIDYALQFGFDANGLSSVQVYWKFDRMFSSFIRKQFDKDNNNEFDSGEVRQIRAQSFGNLAKNQYFAYVKQGKKSLAVPEPANFQAKLVKKTGEVEYYFTLPIVMNAADKERAVSVYFFDPVIYVSFTVTKKDVSVGPGLPGHLEVKTFLKKVKYVYWPTIRFKKQS